VPSAAPRAYAVLMSPAVLPQAMVTLQALRAAGVSVQMHAGGGGMKAQFKKADASGAAWALIFGESELAAGEVALKSLRDPAVTQRNLPLSGVSEWAAELRNA